MIRIQEKNPSGRQQNQPLDAVVTIIIQNKITIDHAIYINIFSKLTVSYLIVSNDDVLNTTNNETNFPLNRYEGSFCLQCMIRIQEKNPSGRQQNQPLDAVVTIIIQNKITIDHAIYINIFSKLTVSYLIVSNDDVLNTTNNEIEFTEVTRVFEEYFYIKVQEVYVLKYLNLRFFSLLLVSVLIRLITSRRY